MKMFQRIMNSFLFRSSDLFYAVFPRKAVLRFYCALTYALRLVTWRLACRFYGPGIIRYRGDLDEFILSQINQGERVLDVGCGSGRLTRLIAGKAGKAVGVDMNNSYLGQAAGDPTLPRNVSFMAGDISDIKLAEIFDLAVLIHIIEHLRDSGAVLNKLARSARRIIIETPDCEADWITKLSNDLGIEAPGDDMHVKLYDAGSLKEELERNGWTDVTMARGYGVLRAAAHSKYQNPREIN